MIVGKQSLVAKKENNTVVTLRINLENRNSG